MLVVRQIVYCIFTFALLTGVARAIEVTTDSDPFLKPDREFDLIAKCRKKEDLRRVVFLIKTTARVSGEETDVVELQESQYLGTRASIVRIELGDVTDSSDRFHALFDDSWGRVVSIREIDIDKSSRTGSYRWISLDGSAPAKVKKLAEVSGGLSRCEFF